jgi:hypothetical protein
LVYWSSFVSSLPPAAVCRTQNCTALASNPPIYRCPLPPFSNPIANQGSACRDTNCCRYVEDKLLQMSTICAGRVVQDRIRQHSHWTGGPSLLMERMEHTLRRHKSWRVCVCTNECRERQRERKSRHYT